MNYIRDPGEITRRSFEIVRRETAFGDLPAELAGLVTRLVHACGMPDIISGLEHRGDVVGAGRAALRAGAPILVDCAMVKAGITARRLPADNSVLCMLDDVTEIDAKRRGATRSAAAVELWRPHMLGAVVAIGNAPTALFRLLEMLWDGAPKPAAIFGFPVGFVGAAESKQALIESGTGVPFVTLRGRRGGSALAAAGVNSLTAGE